MGHCHVDDPGQRCGYLFGSEAREAVPRPGRLVLAPPEPGDPFEIGRELDPVGTGDLADQTVEPLFCLNGSPATGGIAIVDGDVVGAWAGWVALPIGAGLAVASAEFLGPNEERGWKTAGKAVPLLYVAWSAWLVALGLALAL